MYVPFESTIRYNAEGGAPAPAAAPPAAAPAPTPAAAPSDVVARLEALEGALAKAKADNAALIAARDSAATEKNAGDARIASLEKARTRDKVENALVKAMKEIQFTNGRAADQAAKLFQAEHRIEMKEDSVLATNAAGQTKHIGQSFTEWLKTDGATFLAAPAQPGHGVPNPASPTSPGEKKLADMGTEDLRALMKNGAKMRVTADKHAPVVTIVGRSNPALEARRAELMAQMFGRGKNGAAS